MTAEPNDVDTIKQWGIKAIPARVIKEISDAAYDRKITNGQMIERLWEHWKADGEPVQVNGSSPMSEDQITARIMALAAFQQSEAAMKSARMRRLVRRSVLDRLIGTTLEVRANGHAAEGEP